MKLIMKSESEFDKAVAWDYWAYDGVSLQFIKSMNELTKNHDLDEGAINLLIKQSCQVVEPDVICLRCEQPMKYRDREDYRRLAMTKKRDYICPECVLKSKREERAAVSSHSKHNNNDDKKLKSELKRRFDSRENIEFSSLTIEQACKLLALLYHSANRSKQIIEPIYKSNESLVPNSMEPIFLMRLYDSRLISISPDTNPEAVVFVNDEKHGDQFAFVDWSVSYIPNIGSMNATYLTKALEAFFENIDLTNNKTEIQEITKALAVHECYDLVHHYLQSFGWQESVESEIMSIITKLVEQFSVSESYSIIGNCAMRIAESKYIMGDPGVMADAFISHLEQLVDSVITINPQILFSNRHAEIPQSVYSRVVFSTLLKLDGDGFYYRPDYLLRVMT